LLKVRKMVYKCLNNVTGTAVAQKMYKNPYLIDTERARVVDQAMSDTGNGPQVFGFEEDKPALTDDLDCCDFSACDPYVEGCADCTSCPQDAYFSKFEELLYGKSLDKVENWEANQPEVYRVAAKLFAKLHIVTQKDVPRKINNCYQSWPWNTRAMVGALANWPPTTTDFVTQLIEEHPIEEGSVKITNLDEYMAFLYDLAYASISPNIWAHNDLHPGNFYVRDAPEGTPMDERLLFIDYDNSDFGTRNFDFTYYLLNSDFSDEALYNDFLTAYVREYNKIGPRELTYEQLDQELICQFPWAYMNRVYLFATYGGEQFAKLFYLGFKGWAEAYGKGDVSCPWEGRYQEYPKCYPIA